METLLSAPRWNHGQHFFDLLLIALQDQRRTIALFKPHYGQTIGIG